MATQRSPDLSWSQRSKPKRRHLQKLPQRSQRRNQRRRQRSQMKIRRLLQLPQHQQCVVVMEKEERKVVDVVAGSRRPQHSRARSVAMCEAELTRGGINVRLNTIARGQER